jgi:osmotically-inducible protein OsmY
VDTRTIEREIQRLAGVQAAVQESDDEIVVSGMVQSPGEREAALDVARSLSGGQQVVDDLEVLTGVPDELEGRSLVDVPGGNFPETMAGTADDEALEPGDFTDQNILENAEGASGEGYTGSTEDEDLSDGEEVYVPPTDPPRTRDNRFLGGFQTTSMDDSLPASGDESLRESIQRELLEDAATTDLEIEVEVRRGVALLRGKVQDMQDVDNAMGVAERIPGVVEVVDELTVVGL